MNGHRPSFHNLTKSPTPLANPPSTSDLRLPATADPPSTSKPPKPKVWLIFGATGHMGRSLVKRALARSDSVAAVGRTFENTLDSMQDWYPSDPSRYLGLLCDVRVRSTVAAALDATLDHFGCVDVIAICSGLGVIGACEDQDDHEIRSQFETNFVGTLNIIQLSLPYFRSRRATSSLRGSGSSAGGGRYLVFSSTSGALGVPGLGPYCATKYAVEGLIESMLYETDAFHIRPTLVEIGHLRRDDVHAEPGSDGAMPLFGHFKVKAASEPYSARDSPANHARRMLQWIGNNQATSAVKVAELVWQLAHCSYPPLRLILGTFAVESVRDRLKGITEEIEDWKHLNYPTGEEGVGEGEGEGDGEDDEDRDDDEMKVEGEEQNDEDEDDGGDDEDGDEDEEGRSDDGMDDEQDQDEIDEEAVEDTDDGMGGSGMLAGHRHGTHGDSETMDRS